MRGHESQWFLLKKINQNWNIKTKKSWEPFRSCLLAQFGWKLAGLVVLFSRQLLNGSKDFFPVLMFCLSFIFLNMKPLRPMPAHFCRLIFQLYVVCIPLLWNFLHKRRINWKICSSHFCGLNFIEVQKVLSSYFEIVLNNRVSSSLVLSVFVLATDFISLIWKWNQLTCVWLKTQLQL